MPFLVLVLVGGVVGSVMAVRRVQSDLAAAASSRHESAPYRGTRPNAAPLPPEKAEPVYSPVPAAPRPNRNGVPRAPEAGSAEASVPSTTGIISFEAARARLHLVGADIEADAFWLRAINDPRLSANQRKDLIEDLNQEGFADPRNPTEDDLPLIMARLQLIEDHSDGALDAVNAAAFEDAYKDLLNMLDQALDNQSTDR